MSQEEIELQRKIIIDEILKKDIRKLKKKKQGEPVPTQSGIRE